MRGTIERAQWAVPVDLFFYREVEELEKAEEARGYDEIAAAPSSYEKQNVPGVVSAQGESYKYPEADAAGAAGNYDAGQDGWDQSASNTGY